AVVGAVVVEPDQVGGIRALHEPRKRLLRAPGAGNGSHGEATDEPDQDDDSEVAAPPAAEGSAESVARDAKSGPHSSSLAWPRAAAKDDSRVRRVVPAPRLSERPIGVDTTSGRCRGRSGARARCRDHKRPSRPRAGG